MNADREHAKGALGALITQLRTEAGLSMYQVAKLSGLNRSSLKRLEDGEHRHATVDTLNTLAEVLHVDPERLYDAAWRNSGEPLPSPAVYLRCKYHLNDSQIARVQAAIRRVISKPNGSYSKH
jgi:transcriptional regulator with XRE-family HTH domain